MNSTIRTALLATLFALASLHPTRIASAANNASDARRLHMEQQQHSLELKLRQSVAARNAALSASDVQRLERLHMQQRLEQQQLELQQLQRDRAMRQHARAFPHDTPDPHTELQRELFAQERELQNQRFELDRQRLLQSLPRQPLQPPIGSSQLNLSN